MSWSWYFLTVSVIFRGLRTIVDFFDFSTLRFFGGDYETWRNIECDGVACSSCEFWTANTSHIAHWMSLSSSAHNTSTKWNSSFYSVPFTFPVHEHKQYTLIFTLTSFFCYFPTLSPVEQTDQILSILRKQFTSWPSAIEILKFFLTKLAAKYLHISNSALLINRYMFSSNHLTTFSFFSLFQRQWTTVHGEKIIGTLIVDNFISESPKFIRYCHSNCYLKFDEH